MQIYALTTEGQWIHAKQAFRQVSYACIECQKPVRLRSGVQRQPHFYHLEPTPHCRQHQKGRIHLEIQHHLLKLLPAQEAKIECYFPTIKRIADVAWHARKIVFEIQYSFISGAEVLKRNFDYQQLGWTVVWILHDHRYNQRRLSAAENVLTHGPHYFCNKDSEGKGIIYDQYAFCEKGLRLSRLAPLEVFLDTPQFLSIDKSLACPSVLIKQRMQRWPFYFKGDLINLFLNEPACEYLQALLKKEKAFYPPVISWNWRNGLKRLCAPYRAFLRMWLERACR